MANHCREEQALLFFTVFQYDFHFCNQKWVKLTKFQSNKTNKKDFMTF